MAAQIIPLLDPAREDAAWDAYASVTRQAIDNPHLLCDREYMERRTLLHKRWERQYMGRAGA